MRTRASRARREEEEEGSRKKLKEEGETSREGPAERGGGCGGKVREARGWWVEGRGVGWPERGWEGGGRESWRGREALRVSSRESSSIDLRRSWNGV